MIIHCLFKQSSITEATQNQNQANYNAIIVEFDYIVVTWSHGMEIPQWNTSSNINVEVKYHIEILEGKIGNV